MMHAYTTRRRLGFTLVESAIVIVIASLLIGFILIGRDFVRSAQVRAVANNIEGLRAAVSAFQEKYDCIPGDCANATFYFGTNPSCPSAYPLVAGVCNGNGDGRLYPYTGWANGEVGYAVAELYQANLWSLMRYGAMMNAVLEAKGLLPTDFIYLFTNDLYGPAAGATPINGRNGNTFAITNQANGTLNATVLSAEETYQVDVKIDDGLASSGRLMGRNANIPSPTSLNADVACLNGSSAYDRLTTGARCKILYYWSN